MDEVDDNNNNNCQESTNTKKQIDVENADDSDSSELPDDYDPDSVV